MPVRMLRSLCRQEFLPAADGVEVWDLAVNPLSVVLLHLKPLNDTTTLSNFVRAMGIAGAVNRVSVLYRGQSVFSMSGRDALALHYFRHGGVPWDGNPDDADNERRSLTIPIVLGRFPWDPASCFPASRRGELTMEVDIDIADTGYDGMRMSCETIELLGAEPKEYERCASISKTFAATGDQDFELPIGHVVRGLLLFGTTAFDGASPAPTWGRISLMLDNQQVGYASTDWECVRSDGMLFGRQPPTGEMHTHRVDATAASTTQETSGGPIEVGDGGEGWENYAFLDLDPTRDDMLAIDTAGANDFTIRADVETADAARVVPIERIAL